MGGLGTLLRREPTGQQQGVRRVLGAELVHAFSNSDARLQERTSMFPGVSASPNDHEVGAHLPPLTALAAKQQPRFACRDQCLGGVLGGQRSVCGCQEQLGPAPRLNRGLRQDLLDHLKSITGRPAAMSAAHRSNASPGGAGEMGAYRRAASS